MSRAGSPSSSSSRTRPRAVPGLPDDPLWYKDAVIYQLHVRGFFDSNDDGVGDFDGLTSKLDYIQALGVSAIWLQPFYPSPLRDDGYDIAQYEGVHPSYGTRRDFARFLAEAHARGLRVITELVINHTSDQHPWFQAARRARPGTSKRDFYVWSDTPEKYAGVPIIFKDTERSNWTWDPIAGAYFWHRFFHHQPDLNFDNPRVKKAVLRVMRFWLDLGVDGMRLDAVPYLVEREGTQCANLPETHAILKDIRRELDASYTNRMLLAEANQWPSDVRAYFGDNDECHMAFHFPLMPRLYMALRQEDRHPLSEILWQMPDIPDACQWALFLRNHDELTLEMVSDEERDYLYQTYAADPQMRLNVGIRRRLAPLMENSRPRLELMHGLLLSLPGTPVLYYGDELGMGDNVYLGDRNGVRTPMQWSADRNGGFSRADPARLYSPAIMDPVFGYQAVNVEAQDRSAHSLLNWMRRLIALRQRYAIFGRGSMELLRPTNRHIFAFIRRLEGADPVLVVANLSRTVQAVSLDLARVAGLVPVEMSGGVDLPRVTDAPYFLTLGPHAFLWLLLRRDPSLPLDARTRVSEPDPEQVPLLVGPDWTTLFDGSTRDLIAARYLPGFLRRQSWFADAAASLTAAAIVDWGVVAGGEEPALIAIVRATLAGDSERRYALPLTATPDDRADEVRRHAPAAVLAPIGGARKGLLHARLGGPAGRALVSAMTDRRRVPMRHGALHGSTLPDVATFGLPARIEDLPGAPFDLECPSSVTFGERVVVKVVRRLWPGASAEATIAGAIRAVGDPPARVPAIGAVLEYRASDGTPYPVALLESYVPHQHDAWHHVVAGAARFLESPDIGDPPPASGVLPTRWWQAVPEIAVRTSSDTMRLARTIGRRAAGLHAALAAARESLSARTLAWTSAAGPAEPWERAVRALADASSRHPEHADLARRLGDRDREIRAALHAARDAGGGPASMPIHGRFDLQRVLVYEGEVTFIDAASDPAVAPDERLRARSLFVDLGRMLWSCSLAARTALDARLAAAAPPHDRPIGWTRRWVGWIGASFLEGYTAAADGERAAALAGDRETLEETLWRHWLLAALGDVTRCAAQSPAALVVVLEALLDALADADVIPS